MAMVVNPTDSPPRMYRVLHSLRFTMLTDEQTKAVDAVLARHDALDALDEQMKAIADKAGQQ